MFLQAWSITDGGPQGMRRAGGTTGGCTLTAKPLLAPAEHKNSVFVGVAAVSAGPLHMNMLPANLLLYSREKYYWLGENEGSLDCLPIR